MDSAERSKAESRLHAQSDIVRRMVEEFVRGGVDAVIAFQNVPREEVVHYGIAKPRGAAIPVFELADIVEKPSVAEAPSTLAVAVRYVFAPRILDLLEKTPPGKGGEIQLTDVSRRVVTLGAAGISPTIPGGPRPRLGRHLAPVRSLGTASPALATGRPGRSDRAPSPHRRVGGSSSPGRTGQRLCSRHW